MKIVGDEVVGACLRIDFVVVNDDLEAEGAVKK